MIRNLILRWVLPISVVCTSSMAFAQSNMTPEEAQAMLGVLGILSAIGGVFGLLVIISMWKVFTKAGKPGWASIIPFYNVIVMLQIANKPAWWFLLFFVPVANVIFQIIVLNRIAQAFGKDVGMTIALIFVVGWPVLAFGSARYVGFPGEPQA